MIERATVIQCGPASHPESGADLMRITVSKPWASGGTTYPSTDIWAARDCPELAFGETVQWGSRYVWARGVRYDKPEFDSDPNAVLE